MKRLFVTLLMLPFIGCEFSSSLKDDNIEITNIDLYDVAQSFHQAFVVGDDEKTTLFKSEKFVSKLLDDVRIYNDNQDTRGKVFDFKLSNYSRVVSTDRKTVIISFDADYTIEEIVFNSDNVAAFVSTIDESVWVSQVWVKSSQRWNIIYTTIAPRKDYEEELYIKFKESKAFKELQGEFNRLGLDSENVDSLNSK